MNKEKYIDNILLENDRLYKENQQLHNKIDKAIEYTKKHSEDAGYLDVREVKGLLEILKGDKNE